MKPSIESGLIHHPSKESYLSHINSSPKKTFLKNSLPEGEKSLPEDRVELSESAGEQKDKLSDAADKLAGQAREEAKKTLDSLPLDKVGETALKTIAREAALKNGLNIQPVHEKMAGTEGLNQLEGWQKDFVKSDLQTFFIRGFNWWGLSSDGGLQKMSEEIPNSSYHSWSEKDEMIEDIMALPSESPVAIIGHSLGGDQAVELARELNQVSHGYRQVDLLVTLDSVGFDNNIIPSNVKKNLNFIAEHGGLLSDGPNMPRDESKTKVLNELRSEKHTRIDESEEIQQNIFNHLQGIAENQLKGLENYSVGPQKVSV